MNTPSKDNLHKEIDLIQSCIKRMSSNSFLLKGWTISIVAVVLALSEKNFNHYLLCFIILIPLVSFWYLDAFFLYTEKLYRKMYEWVITERPNGKIDYMYDLNPHRFKNVLKKIKNGTKTNENETIYSVMWSITLRNFYFIPISIVIIIIISMYLLTPNITQKNDANQPKSNMELQTKNSTSHSKM